MFRKIQCQTELHGKSATYREQKKQSQEEEGGQKKNPWNFCAKSWKDILQQQQTGLQHSNDFLPCSFVLGLYTADLVRSSAGTS